MSNSPKQEQKYKPFFDQALKDLGPEIGRQSEMVLKSEDIIERFVAKYSVDPPVLDKASTRVMIKEETIKPSMAPEGMEFETGDKVSLAQFRVPVKGTLPAFKFLADTEDYASKEVEVRGGVVIYKFYSWEGPLEASEARLKKARSEAKSRFEEVEKTFESFAAEAAAFNKSLPKEIKPLIEKQLGRIKKRRESEEKLNPFA